MAKNCYAVFGAGSFGAKLALALTNEGHDVLVCDRSAAKIDEIRDQVADAVIGDVSNEGTVRELNVSKFDAVILGMSSYFEDQVLALTLLKQEGAKKVIVKSGSPIQERTVWARMRSFRSIWMWQPVWRGGFHLPILLIYLNSKVQLLRM